MGFWVRYIVRVVDVDPDAKMLDRRTKINDPLGCWSPEFVKSGARHRIFEIMYVVVKWSKPAPGIRVAIPKQVRVMPTWRKVNAIQRQTRAHAKAR